MPPRECVVRIAQIAQRAVDLDRAVTFYQDLLGHGAAARFDPPGLAFFTVDGVRLLLDGAAPSALVYLAVASVRSKTEELRRRGVAIRAEPHIIFHHEDAAIGPAGTDEWMSFIVDSEGNTVGLISWEPAEPT
jgi:methylmalonyl-CoA/ethylmalonyl-CoA epimerase